MLRNRLAIEIIARANSILEADCSAARRIGIAASLAIDGTVVPSQDRS
jgi:hypothetical protein